MEMETVLKSEITQVLNQLYGYSLGHESIKLEQTNADFKGDYTLVTFPFVRLSKFSPEQTANAIGEALMQKSTLLNSFNVVKGFLNIELKQYLYFPKTKK
jgi:arginyl-tRNA synthetase